METMLTAVLQRVLLIRDPCSGIGEKLLFIYTYVEGQLLRRLTDEIFVLTNQGDQVWAHGCRNVKGAVGDG